MISYILSPLLSVFYFVIGKITNLVTFLFLKFFWAMIGLMNPYNMITSSTKNLFSFNINPFRQKKKSFSFLSYINPFKKEEKKKGLFSSFFS
ncbi:hypothetical protein [Lumpy skin disease virus]|uniref:LS153 n=2 Tax=Lumpy skin disease virus TaxID=59509 RepID=A0A1C9HI07_LSDV|nr:hypothetical protein [Lumpy skin disease virus]AOO78715.1 hypothetical protein [Lumpy skin disease virus]AOO78873.1 hypothetical protein [Lumpy skin disease virus]AOO79032.1 hypothetical protein [Lumpy skin disease virus]AVR51592.1 hypothetical protein [Lumpy skin disease virus]